PIEPKPPTVPAPPSVPVAPVAPPPVTPSAPLVQRSVQGTLAFDNGLPAVGLTVRAYNIGFAGQDAKVGEDVSKAQGQYAMTYNRPKGTPPNVQVRIAPSPTAEITISNTLFNAQTTETLNLVVPSTVQPLSAEFDRLSTDLTAA